MNVLPPPEVVLLLPLLLLRLLVRATPRPRDLASMPPMRLTQPHVATVPVMNRLPPTTGAATAVVDVVAGSDDIVSASGVEGLTVIGLLIAMSRYG